MPAALAIKMGMLLRYRVKTDRPLAENQCPDTALPAQKAEVAIHRPQADMRQVPAQGTQELARMRVRTLCVEQLQYHRALPGLSAKHHPAPY